MLFLHKKGPAEILIPTAIFAGLGNITETTARLSFTIANLTALAAIYWLGRRLLGPIAGLTAALLLAVDGFYIGFSRVVQYQSIVICRLLPRAGSSTKLVAQNWHWAWWASLPQFQR